VTVFVKQRGEGATRLREHVAELMTKASANKHLSREQFAAQFGPDPEAISVIQRFARRNGLHVLEDPDHPGKPTVELAGTVRALSHAFGVRLQLIWTPHGVYRAPVSRIHIPPAVAPAIDAVTGFDSRPIARPHFRYVTAAPGRGRLAAARAAARSFDPPQVATLYDFPTGTDGSGETVAIIEFGGGYQAADLDEYFRRLHIAMPRVEAVSVDAATNSPTGDPNSADGEVELDIEIVGSVAPGADIAVYFAPNNDRSFANAILAAVHDAQRKPSIISISWGGPESSWPAGTRRLINRAMLAAAAMGVTVFVAAGDSGSSDGVRGPRAHVDFPASSRFAVGCGGTRLRADADHIAAETVWNDGAGGATGGGVSSFFRVPAFQRAIDPVSANPGRRPGRGVPDVAGNASPATGYNVLVDGVPLPVGGTSAVAPLWAGLTARLQQGLGRSVAPLLPALYANPDAFRDIRRGSNGAYSAGRGWDACTGLGSPNGTALADALATASESQGRSEASSGRRKSGKSASARGNAQEQAGTNPNV